jgi:hypothetical protein
LQTRIDQVFKKKVRDIDIIDSTASPPELPSHTRARSWPSTNTNFHKTPQHASPAVLALALHKADPSLDPEALTTTISKLRDFHEVPGRPDHANAIQAICRKTLANGSALRAQRDGHAAHRNPGTPIAGISTWSLSEDAGMVETANEVCSSDSDADMQFQHMHGKVAGQPVATGKAMAIMHAMMQPDRPTEVQDGLATLPPLTHFHCGDILPANNLASNEQLDNGTYKTPSDTLFREFETATVDPLIGNASYAMLMVQGAQGAAAFKRGAERKKMTRTHATDDVYKVQPPSPPSCPSHPVASWTLSLKTDATFYQVLGLESPTQAELTTTKIYGLEFINHGEQVALFFGSMGSLLSGPASGGGDHCVIASQGLLNCGAALMGLPHISPLQSPLLALTSGKGHGAQQLQRIAKQMKVRSASGWRHPSQDGGTPPVVLSVR